MKKHFRFVVLPVLLGMLIFAATCLVQSDDIPKLNENFPWDKIVHFGMFFVLSFVNCIDYYKLYNGKPDMRKWVFWGFTLPVIYGGAIELLQEYFFSRSGEWGDFIADVSGSLVAMSIVLFLYFQYWRKGKKTIFVKKID